MQENKILKLSEIEHVLKRPGQYIGSLNYCSKEMFLFNNDKFIFDNVSYIPGLDKCLNEILDNCIDEAIRTNFKFANKIEININEKSAQFIDNGRGVPCEKNDDGISQLELAFNNARAGANFGDDSKRETVGMNGVGSFCVNCFSKLFIVKTNTDSASGTLITKNNLSESDCKIRKHVNKKTGTDVYFEPDFEKFGISGFDKTHIDLLYQRVLNLAICFPEITFYFNNTKIKINNKTFIKYFNENSLVYDYDNVLIGILPNEYDDFKYYSYVNGIKLIGGGNHIDLITTNIVNGLRDKLQRKYKNIMPGDIKHKLSLVVFFKHFKNLKFDSQTKERLTNSNTEINNFLNESGVDYTKIIKDILKNEHIITPIIDAFTVKEELKVRKELKTKQTKKIKSDKYFPPIGDLDMLFINEGFSASGGISSVLGRKGIGYYALKGVILNVYDTSLQKIANNVELKELSQILGFQLGVQNEIDIKCNKIVVATDQDADGFHISLLLFGMFYKYLKKLYKQKRILRLTTPLVVLYDNKNNPVQYFFTLDDYKQYKNTNNYRVKYYKGLGSWKKEELQVIINKKGLDYFLQPFILDEQTEQYFNWWLSDKTSDKRKEFIQNHSFNIEAI